MHSDATAFDGLAKPIRFNEIYGVEPEGRIFGCVVMDCADDDHAIRIAGEHFVIWKATVKLYETPDINLSSVSSFDMWPDQMRLVKELRWRRKKVRQ
jgi:hypothetical protein